MLKKMKNKIIFAGLASLMIIGLSGKADAQTGNRWIHDPSTIMEDGGKYFTFGTGGGGLISEDGGWTWNGGGVRPGGGAAPDAIKIGDRYLVVYGATGGGLGGGHKGTILTMWNKTLDPNSTDFKYSEPIVVASSEYDEDCDSIDPSVLMDPDGRLWLSYGTYFGFIRLVELDPKTGARVEGNEPINIAIDCEASALMYNDGWYYLLGTHGTCCDGVNSTYNIVVGRSRKVTGPYLDNLGRDMLKGGGKMVISSDSRHSGPGHFGRYIEEPGVEKMSFHYEADFDEGGRSVLAIAPLVWKNGWPVAGDVFREGTYEIESERRGYGLELVVDFVRMNTGRVRFWGPPSNEPLKPVEEQKLEEVIGGWPEGDIDVRIGDYLGRPHQKWTVEAVEGVGGYLGAPYYKITIAGTGRALAATADAEVKTVPEFTGAPEQLWRIEMLTDGTYRIMPKEVPGHSEQLVLVSVADSTPSLGKFDKDSDNCKWNFRNR